jgi:hypothetical protein
MTPRLQTRFVFTNFTKSKSNPATDYLTVKPDSSYYPTFPCVSKPGDCSGVNALEMYNKVRYRKRLYVHRDEEAHKGHRQRSELHYTGYIGFLKEKVEEEDIAQFNNAAVL